jgi:hypothetical protein
MDVERDPVRAEAYLHGLAAGRSERGNLTSLLERAAQALSECTCSMADPDLMLEISVALGHTDPKDIDPE